jgi:hypothetical protein
VISMYARVCTQSLTLIEQVMVKIFEVVQRWVAGHVWVRVSTTFIYLITMYLLYSRFIYILGLLS